MVGDEQIMELAYRWLRWSDEDLLAARFNITGTEIAPRVACTLGQQAAEKAIKALLVAADIEPPKSHNLILLSRMLNSREALQLLNIDLEEVSRWAIEGRYPADVDEANADDAARAVELAMQVNAVAHRVMERSTQK